jgi:L-ascorbate metabolism protein UlaG (beta-lactamase superfamily)
MRILPFFSLLTLAACAGTGTGTGTAARSPSAAPAAAQPSPDTSSLPVESASAVAPAAAAAPLTLTYLGVAGWSISDGAHTVLVDPYFSRPNLAAGAKLASDPVALDAAFASGRLPARADVILVGHSHVDHVLDAPAVARRTGASVMGTASTSNYARATGLPVQQVIPVKGGEDYAFDGFSVRVIPGLHSALDDKHLLGADQLIPPGKLPTTMDEFAEGGTLNYLVRLGGRQVLVIGSANFIERELVGLRPDIAIVATGLRQEIYDYTCRLLRTTGNPPLVLTTHFDAWTKPAETPLSDAARKDLADFTAEVKGCAPATRVIVPRTFEPMRH